jgi:hypothetical protein
MTTTARSHSLSSIAIDCEVDKRTVKRWLEKAKKEHGVIGEIAESGHRCFDDSERDILLTYKSDLPKRKPKAGTAKDMAPNQDSETPLSPTTVLSGNGRSTLKAPLVPQTVNLSQFRRRGSLSADRSTVSDAVMAVRAIRQGLKADLEHQWQQLEATQADEKLVTAELQALEREASEYRVTSDILARLETQSAVQVQEELAKVESLGKPPSGDQSQSS